jgi:hypothetical protein
MKALIIYKCTECGEEKPFNGPWSTSSDCGSCRSTDTCKGVYFCGACEEVEVDDEDAMCASCFTEDAA